MVLASTGLKVSEMSRILLTLVLHLNHGNVSRVLSTRRRYPACYDFCNGNISSSTEGLYLSEYLHIDGRRDKLRYDYCISKLAIVHLPVVGLLLVNVRPFDAAVAELVAPHIAAELTAPYIVAEPVSPRVILVLVLQHELCIS